MTEEQQNPLREEMMNSFVEKYTAIFNTETMTDEEKIYTMAQITVDWGQQMAGQLMVDIVAMAMGDTEFNPPEEQEEATNDIQKG